MSRLTKPDRCWRILEVLLRENRPFKTGEILALLQTKDPRIKPNMVSTDLAKLQELGLVSTLGHGVWDKAQSPFLSDHSTYREKLGIWSREKAGVAKYIVGAYLREATGLVGLDAGTSVTAVFRELVNVGASPDVLTSNIDGAWHLLRSHYSGRIELRGGVVDVQYAVATDSAGRKCDSLQLESAVVGVSSCTEDGLATNDTSQHPFKKWLCDAAAQVIVPVTIGKLLKQNGVVFQTMDALRRAKIVTDNNISGLTPRAVRKLERELERLDGQISLVNVDGELVDKVESWV